MASPASFGINIRFPFSFGNRVVQGECLTARAAAETEIQTPKASRLGSNGWMFYCDVSMKTLFALLVSAVAFGSAIAPDDSSKEIRNTSVIDSGTYKVTAKKVDPDEKEIYVTTADGKTLELYFSKATKLTRGGKDVAFDALKNGQKLEIQIEKAGNKLKPLAVAILE